MNAGAINNFNVLSGKSARHGQKQKAGLHFHTVRQVRQEWRGKASHEPAPVPTDRPAEKFHQKSIVAKKIREGMAAMQMLHCTILTNHLYA
ncbi:hypothetical protein [Mesorhizobium sp.]|uniref:hypothetical protein n=1 Tax=Mesorhizobium sp. TaxID=1871066 RepID=UPI0025ECFCAB|nr:hypothetical protein [Mesorhizobium sp.]